MKVFEITAAAKPPKTRFEYYAPLVVTERDRKFLKWDDFHGSPFQRKWKPIQLYVTMPLLPRPDFYNSGTGAFVCTQKAVEVAGEPLGMCGELLPVKVEQEKGKFFIYNVTNCINAVDHRKSKWERLMKGKKLLTNPAFLADRLGALSVFKIPEDFGIRIYCLERTGDSEDGEFKAVVEHNGLTGLRFEMVWSDEGCGKKRSVKRASRQ